jgi:predicted RNA binding protein YcfA (HicA-like mRNA interferase family)
VKLPRDVSGRQAVRALERLGFARTRQRGSHIRLKRGKDQVTVPDHLAIAPGTLLSIVKQAGVSLDEFLQQL